MLQALTRGLEDVAHVEPWTTSFNPGTTTLKRLLELAHEFAAFVFAQDDWTASDPTGSGQASPRDNVVFEAGLFGRTLGMRRTFILHANGRKLPSDRPCGMAMPPAPLKSERSTRNCERPSRAPAASLASRGCGGSFTERSVKEPSAVSLLRVARDREGALEIAGRSWQEDGSLPARYWSEASKDRKYPACIFYYWKGERPKHPNAPQLEGTGEIRIESADRAAGYFTTRSDADPEVKARTSGVYLRADAEDMNILDGRGLAGIDFQSSNVLPLAARPSRNRIAERKSPWKGRTS